MSRARSVPQPVERRGQEPTRREAILAAALAIFTHYGFRRASLDEIAREAGISRTGLYHHFRNKQEIFRALAATLQAQSLAAAEAAVATAQTLEDRLRGAFRARHVWFYAQVANSRHGLELLSENTRLSADVLAESNQRYRKLLARVLTRADKRGEVTLRQRGLTPDTAASFLVLCADGLKGPPTVTAAEYEQRLGLLITIVVSGLRE